MAHVYFKGTNVGTLENSIVKRLKGKKLKPDVRNGKAILINLEN